METTSRFRFALLRCARLLGNEMNAVLLQHDLNYSLWQSLVIIQMNGQCTAQDISHELAISKPAVTKRINMLIDREMLVLLPSNDKRQKILELTEFGQQKFDVCCTQIDLLETELLKEFQKDDLKQTHQLILDLMHSLQARKEGVFS